MNKAGSVHILRHARSAIISLEKQKVLHILSVCVAFGIQHAKRMCRIAIYGLSASTIFFHIVS